MQMDILRCKTPDMVHKEIWTHLLAYNLLRTVMAVAANENDIEPRQVSFKGAKQALTAFAPKIEAARPEDRGPLIDAMLTTIAYHRVGDRPGRWEPRARKRRPKKAAQTNATSTHRQAAAQSFKMVLGRLPSPLPSLRTFSHSAVSSASPSPAQSRASKLRSRTDRRLCQHASTTRVEQTADRHLAPAD